MSINKKTKTVRFFGAHCKNCNESFRVPLLSDFAYGEFVFTSEDGKTFAHLNAIEEKNFDFIANLLKEISEREIDSELRQGGKYSWSATHLNRLHWVIAQCADEVGGEKLSNQFRCPKCRSGDVLYGDRVVVRDDEIPIVSFESFTMLSESERKVKLRELYNISKSLF